MGDRPIAIVDGRRIYDNAPTTVFILACNAAGQILLIRRATEPGYGLLGLPGGYQMRGETWQEAGSRELFEETGCVIDPSQLELISIKTDIYQNNLIIARSKSALYPTSSDDLESLEVIFTCDIGSRNQWAHQDLFDAAYVFTYKLKYHFPSNCTTETRDC
jgi:ADP-ribose pyrophosphatase YjhB (NUDIX family)